MLQGSGIRDRGRAGISKTLWEFCCRRKKRQGIIARGESEYQKLWVCNMGDVMACLCADGTDPTQEGN